MTIFSKVEKEQERVLVKLAATKGSQIYSISLKQELFSTEKKESSFQVKVPSGLMERKIHSLQKYKERTDYLIILYNSLFIPLAKEWNRIIKRQRLVAREGPAHLNELRHLVEREEYVLKKIKMLEPEFSEDIYEEVKVNEFVPRKDVIVATVLIVLVTALFLLGGYLLNPATLLP